MYLETLPEFTVKNDSSTHLFIRMLTNDRLLCWQEIKEGELVLKAILPHDVEGGKDALVVLGAWDGLSEQAKALNATSISVTTNANTQTIAGVKRGRGRPRKNPISTGVGYDPIGENPFPAVPIVKRGRGRPRKNPLPTVQVQA